MGRRDSEGGRGASRTLYGILKSIDIIISVAILTENSSSGMPTNIVDNSIEVLWNFRSFIAGSSIIAIISILCIFNISFAKVGSSNLNNGLIMMILSIN